jgi:hypothetical protein
MFLGCRLTFWSAFYLKLSQGSFITPRRVAKKGIAVNPTLGQNNTHDPNPKRAA